MERSLVLVKPDGVQRGLVGEVIARLERRGLLLAGAKFMQVGRALAEEMEAYFAEMLRGVGGLQAAANADLLLVVGTSGATNLPSQIGQLCFRLGTPIIDVNPEPNPFSALAERAKHGYAARGAASVLVPEIVRVLTEV